MWSSSSYKLVWSNSSNRAGRSWSVVREHLWSDVRPFNDENINPLRGKSALIPRDFVFVRIYGRAAAAEAAKAAEPPLPPPPLSTFDRRSREIIYSPVQHTSFHDKGGRGLKARGFIVFHVNKHMDNCELLSNFTFGYIKWTRARSEAAYHDERFYSKQGCLMKRLLLQLNYLMSGLTPTWYHATNVALHAAACVLVTRVSLTVASLRPGFAALTGLLFAAHPIHTEATTRLSVLDVSKGKGRKGIPKRDDQKGDFSLGWDWGLW
ncbi:hypothetical protein M0802_012644 [Mischocyttarus mexicanus]|nr:hypothetical protein M0802_012644 [Mischocyttarus mexicanus]